MAALGASLFGGERSISQLVKEVQDRYNGARTLQLNFTETYELQGHRRPAESGVLRLQKQGKMRWDYAQPAGKLFLSDGKTVYLYTAKDNRVEKMAVRDTEDMRAPLAFLLGHLDFKREFRDFRERTAEGGSWLEASAKGDKAPYDKIEMLVGEDGSVGRLKVLGRDGSAMAFTFSNEKLNPALDGNIFRFVIPPGAEVVDAMELKEEGK